MFHATFGYTNIVVNQIFCVIAIMSDAQAAIRAWAQILSAKASKLGKK